VQGNSRDAPGDSPVDTLHTSDLEVLLDLLRNPGLAEKSRALIEKAVVKGLLNEMNVSLPCHLSRHQPGSQRKSCRVTLPACCRQRAHLLVMRRYEPTPLLLYPWVILHGYVFARGRSFTLSWGGGTPPPPPAAYLLHACHILLVHRCCGQWMAGLTA